MPATQSLQAPKSQQVQSPRRIVIEHPAPAVDGGRYPAKRSVGDIVEVSADIFRDGHDVLRAVVRCQAPGSGRFAEAPLEPVDAHHDGVRWAGRFTVDRRGRWEWTIEAWIDPFATWRDELARKVEAGQHDLAGELSEGVVLLGLAAERANDPEDRTLMEHARGVLADPDTPETAKHDAALGPELFAAVERHPDRSTPVRCRSRCRSTSTASAPASAPGTSSSRARGAACAACRSSCRGSPSSASTSSTCRRSTRSATPTARAATTR